MSDLVDIMSLSDISYPGDPAQVLHGDGVWREISIPDITPTLILHGDDPDVERPDTENPVLWIGSVEPNNAVDGDLWAK